MKQGTTWVTVELWDELEDGTEVAQQYDVECSYYTYNGSRYEQPEFDVDIIDYNGVEPNTGLAQLIEIAVRDLNWNDILAEINWLNY